MRHIKCPLLPRKGCPAPFSHVSHRRIFYEGTLLPSSFKRMHVCAWTGLGAMGILGYHGRDCLETARRNNFSFQLCCEVCRGDRVRHGAAA